MNKISCEIIKDLLPLYYDNVCSNDSKLLVEKHNNECTSCRKYLDNIGECILLESENLIKDNIKKNEMERVTLTYKGYSQKTLPLRKYTDHLPAFNQ